MKRTLLIATLLLIQFASFAQSKPPYINTTWPNGLDSVKTSLTALLGGGYTFTKQQSFDKAKTAYITFKNDITGNEITVKLMQGKAAGDIGINTRYIVERVDIYGYFTDIFKIYSKLFDPSANSDFIKAHGNAYSKPMPLNGKQYVASFYKMPTGEAGYWAVTIKD